MVSFFAVAAGRLFCGGTTCASAGAATDASRMNGAAIRRINATPWKFDAFGNSAALANLRTGAICPRAPFADRIWHFVELHCVVSASSLPGHSDNTHDAKNDAARDHS